MCESCEATCCTQEIGRVDISVQDAMVLGDELVNDEGNGYSMKMVDGKCICLDANRRCKIYNKRPGTCRNFPYVSMKPGHCPYRGASS